MTDEILTVLETSKYVKASESTVIREIERGHLKATKFGVNWKIRKSDVDAYLTDRMVNG